MNKPISSPDFSKEFSEKERECLKMISAKNEGKTGKLKILKGATPTLVSPQSWAVSAENSEAISLFQQIETRAF